MSEIFLSLKLWYVLGIVKQIQIRKPEGDQIQGNQRNSKL